MSRKITEVRLLAGVPLENDYKNTIFFENKSDQTNYFLGKTKYYDDDFSYQRKESVIRYPKDYDELVGVNYVMYKNSDFSDKWYYAFITNLEYINDGMTAIHIKTDCIQTWLFDYHMRTSFVERAHVSDDTIGRHTIPEGLEMGEYKCMGRNANESLLVTSTVIGTTVELNSAAFDPVAGLRYNGVYSGIKYYKVNDTELKTIIEQLAKAGKSDAIVSLFTVPALFVDAAIPPDVESTWKYAECESGNVADYGSWINTFGVDEEPITKPTTLDGYTPKNNKLLTYPYCYMSMSNNAGSNAIYKYESFKNPENSNVCDFRIYAALTPGMSIRIVPLNYNGVSKNNDEGLNLGKFPVCAWTNDVYTNWLTQNGINIATSLVSGVASAGFGAAAVFTGAGAVAGGSMIAGGLSQIAGTMGEVYAHSKVPPQVEGNVNSGDVTFSSGYLTFTAHQMTIKKEYAEIIDKYFDMFGYKINRVMIPYRNHRESYWYIKTIDVNIDGNVPHNDLNVIKAAYNKGITFWKNGKTVGDYSQSNEIV